MNDQPRWLAVGDVGSQLARSQGGLSHDEATQVGGAVAAYESTLDYGSSNSVYQRVVDQLSDLIGVSRQRVCLYCCQPLRQHSLTLDATDVQVYCEDDRESLSVAQWIRGPIPIPLRTWVVAVAWWVGTPFVSLGLLGWLPAAASGLMLKRRDWLVTGLGLAIALAFFILGSTVGDDGNPDSYTVLEAIASVGLFFGWLGGSVYGAFQVRPWVHARQPR